MSTIVAIPDVFAQTALLNDKQENILHVAGLRIRVTGAGNLGSSLFNIDSTQQQVLAPIAMSSVTENEPIILANFNQQRTMIRLSTSVIDEIFTITRIIMFVKPVWVDYPR